MEGELMLPRAGTVRLGVGGDVGLPSPDFGFVCDKNCDNNELS